MKHVSFLRHHASVNVDRLMDMKHCDHAISLTSRHPCTSGKVLSVTLFGYLAHCPGKIAFYGLITTQIRSFNPGISFYGWVVGNARNNVIQSCITHYISTHNDDDVSSCLSTASLSSLTTRVWLIRHPKVCRRRPSRGGIHRRHCGYQ